LKYKCKLDLQIFIYDLAQYQARNTNGHLLWSRHTKTLN